MKTNQRRINKGCLVRACYIRESVTIICFVAKDSKAGRGVRKLHSKNKKGKTSCVP